MTPIAVEAHRDVVARTFHAILDAGRDPCPQVVAFDGDNWLGACMVAFVNGDADWRNGGRWAYGEGATEALVVLDAFIASGPGPQSVRPREDPSASDGLVAVWLDGVRVLGAWTQTYHRADDGTLSFDGWEPLTVRSPAFAVEIAACLRGEHGDRPSVAMSALRPRS